jgi:hypothetical protein
LGECDRVVECGAASDHGSARIDVRTGVQQRIECNDVVAARRPVERCLGVLANKAAVDELVLDHRGSDVFTRHAAATAPPDHHAERCRGVDGTSRTEMGDPPRL